MQVVPTKALPNQQLSVSLREQSVILHIRQSLYGLFIDVYVDGTLIIGGVVCENKNWIVRNAYLGFVGDLMFMDVLGNSDPEYSELGTRYKLFYLEPDELPY